MHMIRHHHPIIQHILFAIKMPERIGNHICNLRLLKMALTRSLIQITFNFAAQFSMDFSRRFCWAFCGQSTQCLGIFLLETQQDFLGQRIVQPKSDKIGSAFTFDMRQITSRVDSTAKRTERLGWNALGAKPVFQAL